MNALIRTGMRRRTLIGILLLSALAFAQTPIAPITNFKLPLFNDDGYRTGYLRGEQGIYNNSQSEIRILGMELSQYSGDAQDAVTGSMESPEALFRFDKTGRRAASSNESNCTHIRDPTLRFQLDDRRRRTGA
jgi:hypothetical protein